MEKLVTPMTPSTEFWKNKTVFLTGHTGFKGSWLSLWLSRMGAKVVGFSLHPETKPNLFEAARCSELIDSHIGDICDEKLIVTKIEDAQPDIVIHMAAQALVRSSYEDPIGTYATNVMGTAHVLNSARKVDSVRVVVNVTSDKCYENREWPWGYREIDPMGGYDPYSSSKGCSELVTSAFWRSFYKSKKSVGLGSARAGNVIGGGDWANDRLIPDCIRSMQRGEPISIRNPQSVRPWQHVLEPLSGYLLLAQKLWDQPEIYSQGWNFGPNISQMQPVSWIADRMTKLWGSGAQWKSENDFTGPHEAHLLNLDCTLARTKLGWNPRLNLDESLEWVTEWYKKFYEGEDARSLANQQINRFEART